MRTSIRLVLILLAILAVPGLAQDFRTKATKWIKNGDLAHLVWTVRHERDSALDAFEKVLSEHRISPDQERERWLNTVARAFRLEGVGRPSQMLSKHGYLWAITVWRGTMYEADGPRGEYDLHPVWDH